MTTLGALERSPEVRKGWPVIARALRTLSNVRVRNVATVGGALAHADPHMDLPPLLARLARAFFSRAGKASAIPVEDLYAGYLRKHARARRAHHGNRDSGHGKAPRRVPEVHHALGDDWPAVGVAVVLGDETRIFVSAATEHPTRIADEAAIAGLKIEGDLHGSADYKRHLLRIYLQRAIHEARSTVH